MTGQGLPAEFRLHRYARLDSTNGEALRRLAAGDAGPGDVFLAAEQTAGRGRAGRAWVSLRGNFHGSVVVPVPSGRNAGQLALVAGVALLDAFAAAAPGTAFALKWPNDALWRGRKVAGTLVEAGHGAWVVGVGVNLAAAPADAEVEQPAASLRDAAGIEVPPETLLDALYPALAAWHGRWAGAGFAPVRAAWAAAAHRPGEMLAARTRSGTVRGRFGGLDAEGALTLVDAAGVRRVIAAGDVLAAGEA